MHGVDHGDDMNGLAHEEVLHLLYCEHQCEVLLFDRIVLGLYADHRPAQVVDGLLLFDAIVLRQQGSEGIVHGPFI